MAKRKPSKAATARSEKEPKAKSLTWHGLKLKLPPLLPETFLLRMVQVEEAGRNPQPTFKMLHSVIGEAQFDQVIQLMESSDKVGAKETYELVDAVLAKYGFGSGE